jgi:hypothetical protein
MKRDLSGKAAVAAAGAATEAVVAGAAAMVVGAVVADEVAEAAVVTDETGTARFSSLPSCISTKAKRTPGGGAFAFGLNRACRSAPLHFEFRPWFDSLANSA